jgi:hypothetical protein
LFLGYLIIVARPCSLVLQQKVSIRIEKFLGDVKAVEADLLTQAPFGISNIVAISNYLLGMALLEMIN